MKDWINQVANATGTTPQSVRLSIQAGWEIGQAVKLPGRTRYEYRPHPAKIKELIGIDILGGDDEKEDNRTCRGDNACSECSECRCSHHDG